MFSKSNYSQNWTKKVPSDSETRLQITTGMLNFLYFGKITQILTMFQTLKQKLQIQNF